MCFNCSTKRMLRHVDGGDCEIFGVADAEVVVEV